MTEKTLLHILHDAVNGRHVLSSDVTRKRLDEMMRSPMVAEP